MEDIDRVFARLKRTEYDILVSRIKNGPIVNPHTFEIEYTKWCEPVCIANGWTLKELNNELNRRRNDYK
jgi:hypothetical protein